MSIRTLTVGLLAATVALGAGSAAAQDKLREEAAEMKQFRMQLTGSAGRIYARRCDNCELLALLVEDGTPIRAGRQFLSLAAAADREERGATVLYDPQTLRVTRILFWN